MSKFERWYRLILLILMFPFLPWCYWFLMYVGMTLTGEMEPFFPLYFLYGGFPVLFLVNGWLLLRPSQVLKALYRILVASIAAIDWYAIIKLISLHQFSWKWEIWDVAGAVIISVSALFEVVFMVLGLLRKQSQVH